MSRLLVRAFAGWRTGQIRGFPPATAGLVLAAALGTAAGSLESFPSLLLAASRSGLIAFSAIFFVPRPDVRWLGLLRRVPGSAR